MDKHICSKCGKEVIASDFIMVPIENKDGRWEPLCFECYSYRVAQKYGVELQEFEPVYISMFDIMEDKHEFVIQRRLYQTGVSLTAREIKDGEYQGYDFQVLDKFDNDLEKLMKRLLTKMKKILCNRYITTDNGGMLSMTGDKVIGRIEYDENSEERLPLVVVDGHKYSWEDLGRMVMTFEGFQFVLKMIDHSEDAE